MPNQIAFYPPSGSGGMTLIQSQVLASTATTINFTSIPTTFKNLHIVGAFNNGGSANIGIQFNGDTGAHYSYGIIFTAANVVSGLNSTTQNSSLVGIGTSGALTVTIPNYQGTALGNIYFSSTGVADSGVATGIWAGTDVTSILLFETSGGSFAVGSAFYLYGY